MQRLTKSQIATVRASLLAKQGGRCAVCGLPITKRACLDHDHNTGAVRGVLHSGCNALLGKLENNAARYGVGHIGTFTNGVAAYLLAHMTNTTGYLHPTHKTPDEKRLLRNSRARKARAIKRSTE